MKDPKNWLVVSVFANAILGGLVISLVTENTGFGTVFLIVFLSAVVITYTVINQKTPEEQKEYEASLAPSTKKLTNAETPPLPELYLDAEQQKKRRIAMVHCEDEGCGFGLEFKHPNCTFYFCKEHGTGFNLDLATVSAAGVECELHGKMKRYDLLTEDNVCPRCEKNTLAVLSVGR